RTTHRNAFPRGAPGVWSGQGVRVRRGEAATSSGPEGALEPHHVADHLGHRLVMLGWNLFVDFDGGVQRARQRWILHHRNVVLAGALADLARDRIGALGDADRRVHAALVL